jgi:hypothetical protein
MLKEMGMAFKHEAAQDDVVEADAQMRAASSTHQKLHHVILPVYARFANPQDNFLSC